MTAREPLTCTATDRPLHLTVDPFWDYVCALEFGRTSDTWPDDRRLPAGDTGVVVLLGAPGGRAVGFEVYGWDEFELPEDAVELWSGPRFAIPRLGLLQATLGEALLAIAATFGERPTMDAYLFHRAIDEPDTDRALQFWEGCLDAGDMKAHYGLGYTLLEAGRPREAYAHLRRYTELTPVNAWAWHWRAQACEALGERDEAIGCYRRAIELEEDEGMETDADERLETLLGD